MVCRLNFLSILVLHITCIPCFIRHMRYDNFSNLTGIGEYGAYVMSCMAENCSSFDCFMEHVSNLTIDSATIESVQRATADQSLTPLWQHLRHGRITASSFYRVLTKMESLLSGKKSANVLKLVDSLLNPRDLSKCSAIAHGKAQEPLARAAYISEEGIKHTGLVVKECGIFLSNSHPYLGASPDGVVECECCGKGLLEIKCPVISEPPSPKNVKFLKASLLDSSKSILNKNHAYFGQVQGQLLVCGLNYCDFYVYSEHGTFIQRVSFDQRFATRMTRHLEKFYLNHFALAFYEQCVMSFVEPSPKKRHEAGADTPAAVGYSDLEVTTKVK